MKTLQSLSAGAIRLARHQLLGLILCIGLITLLLAACSGQVRDNEQSAVDDGNGSRTQPAQVEPQTPAPSGDPVVSSVDRAEEQRATQALADGDDATGQARRSVAQSTAQTAVENVAPSRADAPVAVAEIALVQSAGANYGSREADQGLLRHRQPDLSHGPRVDRENYLAIDENGIKRVADEPVSTFSIDVDTAGYSNLRRMITREGRLPPHDAVRLEEMINYFDYDYAAPDDLERPLAVHTETMAAPWNPANQLLMVGMKGFEPGADARPNANLVFLVDVSGSMQSADKLGLVKSSLQLLVSRMRAEDRIAIAVYAGAAGLVLDSTPGSEKHKIIAALDSLTAGGSTNGAAGIQLAYRVAEANKIDGGINRVIIASDGDLNVGVTSIDALKELIEKKRDNGIALTTLGFGTGNYNYSLMEQLADTGNGNAAYIDTLSEAQKVLVEEMQSTLLTIAKDVKIQIEFNPDVVAEYRLIGYENRLLQREDFRNDKVDAGEVGAGHTVTALYELSLVGSGGESVPSLRYRPEATREVSFGDELAYVSVRYKMPEASRSTEFGQPVAYRNVMEDQLASDNIRFAAAVAGFGQLLRGGRHTGDWGYDELLQLARQARGTDVHGYRSEMVKLVELARVL